MIENWEECSRFKTSQRLADQVRNNNNDNKISKLGTIPKGSPNLSQTT